jgi:hypothetical protein
MQFKRALRERVRSIHARIKSALFCIRINYVINYVIAPEPIGCISTIAYQNIYVKSSIRHAEINTRIGAEVVNILNSVLYKIAKSKKVGCGGVKSHYWSNENFLYRKAAI